MATSIRREVYQYLKEKRWDIKCDPLEYWKANKMVYPRLASLARKYQSAPLLSTAKNLLKNLVIKHQSPLYLHVRSMDQNYFL